MLMSRGRPAQNRYLVARYQSCSIDQQSRRSLNKTEKFSLYLNSVSIRSECQHQQIVCTCIYGSIFACRCCALPAVMHDGPGVVVLMRMRCDDACAQRRDWWATSRYTEWRTIPCYRRRTPPPSAWSISSNLFLAPKTGEKQLWPGLDLWSLGSRRPPPGWASNRVTANFQTATWRGWRRRGTWPTWPGSPATTMSAPRR